MKQDTRIPEHCEECATDAALYALGTLPPEKSSDVELRLRSGCPYCIAQVELYSAVADQLSLAITPVTPPAALREKILARISNVRESNDHRKVVRSGDVRWIKMPAPGVEMRPLIGDKTFMVRMQPGAVFPKHDHPNAEQCYVLSGSITDSDGLTLHTGDFVAMSSGIQHDPIRSITGCTLFIAYAD